MSIKRSSPSMTLVQIAMKESIKVAFSKYLLPTTELLHLDESNSISFSYKVPEILCHEVNKKSQFSAGAILAVFDELSSYSLMLKDKTSRGGVSLHLTTEIIDTCSGGKDVKAIITTDKAGKSIGFCTMILTDSQGKILARGKHVKFMPMGFFWDIIASKMFLPITLAFYNFSVSFNQTPFGKFISSLFMQKKKEAVKLPEFTGIGSVLNSFHLNPVDSKNLPNNLINSKDVKVFEFLVQRHFKNILGKLHGGALGVAIEKSCLQSKKMSNGQFIKSIDVKYLSPMKGELLITVSEDPYRVDYSIGTVLNKKDNNICAEFICHWGSI